jgi:hypothetical protein
VSRTITYHCQGPSCETHQKSTAAAPLLGWLLVTWDAEFLDFCSWDCLIKYGATREPNEEFDV